MKDDSPAMTDGPITQQKPAWYSRDGDPVSKGSFVNSLLASSPAIRVIILTSYADDDSVLAAVLAGAHGYVLKEIDSTSLTSAIQAVSEGRSILDPAVTDRALGWLRGLAAGADIPGAEKLSAQEERVLALVAEGQTNKEIATALDLSDKTVKNYLANIFHKLHITRRAQAAVLFVKRQA